MNKILTLLLLLASSAVTAADDYSDIVNRAFESIDEDYRDAWAFTETSTEEEITQIGRFDPRLAAGDRWILLSIDGREPTEEESTVYRDEKAERSAETADDDDEGDDGAHFVTFETLELLENADDHWLFSFVPSVGDDDEQEFMREVRGTLKVVKDGHYVEYIRLQNDGPIKPAIGVRISHFVTDLRFAPAAPRGPIVPLSIDVHVQGRAFLAVRFDEAETIRFSNYEYVGEAAEMVPDR